MKILFTGMGSHHCKRPPNVSFFTVLADLLAGSAEIVWDSPKVSWVKKDLEKYDKIIFGFSPPTALSANKVYGAMNVLGLMFDSPKLKIVVDSPQVWQYKNSINAVIKDPSILFGKFYSKREGYEAATRNSNIVEKATAHMLVSDWPEIFYPGLPWNSNEKVAKLLGFGNPEKIIGLNLDSLLINPEAPRIGRKDYWSIENFKSPWVETLQKSISFPQEVTKIGRKTDDQYALDVIRSGIGLIVPPQDRNLTTWWNYRAIQAMNSSTPIVTHWQDTHNFNSNWSVLAYQVEDMSSAARQVLASTQRNVYLESLPSASESAKNTLEYLLD